MARIIDSAGGGNDTQDGDIVTFSAHGADKIEVPGGEFIADAQMSREGQDLILTAPGGDSVVIEGYFSADPAPVISGPHGSSLSPELVNSFLSSSSQYAQNATATDESPVGAVEELKGEATVTRADGTTEPLALGSPIYQGDVISTDAQGAVNVVFVDETSMAVSANARMAIDEYSFDPATESGTTNFSVLRGVFVFTSGLIGRDDPDDVAIETPVGSIGIRGTIIAGNINPNGESEITVVEGAIVIKNNVMEKTLSQQFETVKLGGMDSDMADMGVLSAKAVGTAFGAVSDVAPSLFSAINDAAKEQAPADANAAEEGAEESGEGETTETPAEQPVQETPPELQMNNLDAPFKTNAFGEEATGEKPPLQKQPVMTAEARADVMEARAEMKAAMEARQDAMMEPPPPLAPNNNTVAGGTTGGGTYAPPPPLELSTATGAQGVRVISDNIGNGIGYSVTGVGDANNDGYADIMFSNNSSSPAQNHTYVAYGRMAGIGTVNLGMGGIDPMITTLTDPDAIGGEVGLFPTAGSSTDTTNTVIQGIGDFDGDGVEDYAIGQPFGDGMNLGSGEAYIVSGATGNVLTLTGMPNFANTGASISALGDINNDGYADVIIGAPGFNTDMGDAFIIYGSSTPPTTIDLPNIIPSDGEMMSGTTTGEAYGSAVAGIGDFNGDGYNDYAVGSPGRNGERGMVTIYSGLTGSMIISAQSTVAGQRLGSDIFNLGDINGDGKSDIMFAGEGVDNRGYIVFGGTNTTISDVNMSPNALKINLPVGHEILGGGAAGDFNGDGYNDFVVAVSEGADAGIYVVYGKTLNNVTGMDNELSLVEMTNHSYAFKMSYAGAGSLDFDFSNVGDTNGDGFDDLVIGITEADGGNGEVYVVHGRQGGINTYVTDGSANDANTLVNNVRASGNGQSLVGKGNENLHDDNFEDISLRGGGGNNNINIENNQFESIDGGFGIDRLRFGDIGGTLDLRGVDSERIQQMEYVEFAQGGQTIILSVENIFNLLKTSDTGDLKISYTGAGSDGILHIDATAGLGAAGTANLITALSEMSGGGTVTYNGSESAGSTFEVFDIGGYTLYIDDTVMANAQVV